MIGTNGNRIVAATLAALALGWLLATCAPEGGSDGSTGYGAITLQLVRPSGAALQVATGNVHPMALANAQSVVATITAPDIGSPLIQTFDATPGVSGGGVIGNVPAGTNRTLTIQAYTGDNGTGTLYYQATVSGIAVTAGATSNLGPVTIYQVAPGTLDDSFGTNGYVISNGAGQPAQPQNLVIDTFGRILIVGSSGSSNLMTVWRYNADGTPDNTFNGGSGTKNYITHAGCGTNSSGQAIALDSAGRIIVVGQCVGGAAYMAVWRFLSDGSPDSTFGPGGQTWAADAGQGTASNGFAVALDSNAKVIIAGNFVGASNFPAVWRYDPGPNKAFDLWAASTTAAYGGSINGTAVNPQAMLLDGNGKCIIAGVDFGTASSVPDYMIVWRFNPALAYGSQFETFPAPGTAYISNVAGAGGGAFARGLAIDGAGRYVVSGRKFPSLADLNTPGGIVVWRWQANGAPDTTFNGTGVFTLAPGGSSQVLGNRLTLDSTGKILVAGRGVLGTDTASRSILLRLNADGSLDSTFNGGYFSTFTDTNSINHGGTAVAVHPTGKLYLLAQRNFPFSGAATSTQLVLYRVNP